MEKIIQTIKISEELRDLVQRADLEQESRKEIIAYLLTRDDINISNERFQRYQDEYTEKLKAFNQAKQLIQDTYIDTKVSSQPDTSWVLDYDSCVLSVKKKD